ncbi:Origin recognition complex subunit [Lachnellula occidentalis]|uniref:Origin recognition complex subunit 2 n=1 Tax=Lachnellula occidentalis TaxID=215460 RepID=A0A8H8S5X8_9HELO|nr:Origin recognition complex subunit [Lachnellula occidentalis]
MKRKKQADEAPDTQKHQPNQKQSRLRSTVDSTASEDKLPSELNKGTTNRRASGEGKDSIAGHDQSAHSEDLQVGEAPEDEPAKTVGEDASMDGKHTVTPRKRPRISPNQILREDETIGTTPNKTLNGKKLFSTPVKFNGTSEANGTPKLARNADRSARRKSTRTLIERTVLGNTSDNDEEEEDIAQHIYESDEEGEIEVVEAGNAPDTPSKRGRPKGTKNRRRSPTPPPQDLPPHEKYFFQNRGGRPKTSDNNLSSLALLDHEEYFSLVRNFIDPQTDDIKALQDLHAKSFNQWEFELSQDFNLCIYGWGSKRSLLMRFADHIYKSQADAKPKIVVINGYVHNLTIRDVLNTIAAAISSSSQKMGSQPAEMLENLAALLEEDKSQTITVIVHSIDRAPLRRPTTQAILSRLSAHPQIRLVASADHPSFPLLWDSSLRSTYNFLFHDCTTFQPYVAEVDVVDEVHELLGRSGRRVGGKEGVSFVLKSLPENAKNLFRVLIGEQLVAMDGGYGDTLGGVDDDEHEDNDQRPGNLRKTEPGVEYRTLYQKAVEEFICSNEMNFRTLLKEFHDHQMIESRKDAMGTEMLSIPFRKEELETILEDIMS